MPRFCGTVVGLALIGAGAAAQEPVGTPNITPAQAAAMAESMMLQFGAGMDLDPEALREATPEQREDMLRGAANSVAARMTERMERMFGMPIHELKGLGEKEVQEHLMARLRPSAAVPGAPRPLPAAPARGFPDGSVALSAAENYTVELTIDDPPGREVLLVAADIQARQIVWRETRSTPFTERLLLLDIAPEPSFLILEVIDPVSRRVIRRYRPVAAMAAE